MSMEHSLKVEEQNVDVEEIHSQKLEGGKEENELKSMGIKTDNAMSMEDNQDQTVDIYRDRNDNTSNSLDINNNTPTSLEHNHTPRPRAITDSRHMVSPSAHTHDESLYRHHPPFLPMHPLAYYYQPHCECQACMMTTFDYFPKYPMPLMKGHTYPRPHILPHLTDSRHCCSRTNCGRAHAFQADMLIKQDEQ